MQEMFGLPLDKWAWLNYQTEVSVDAPQYACKVLSAGGILIALDIFKNKLHGPLSSAEALREYEKRVTRLFDAFQKEFGKTACQGLLGFDAMKFEEYPPEKQEYIAKGTWMKYCFQYIGFIVKTICDDHPALKESFKEGGDGGRKGEDGSGRRGIEQQNTTSN
jgi:hypothetical protein